MKKNAQKLALLLVLALSLALLLALPLSAAEEKKESYKTWEFSEDLQTLTASGEVVYTYWGSEDLLGVDFCPRYYVRCENKAKSPSGLTYQVYTVGEDALAYISMGGVRQIYATEAAMASLDALCFFDEPTHFALMDGRYSGTPLSKEQVSLLRDPRGEGIGYSVSLLQDCLVRTVMATDSAYLLQREWILLFEIDGEVYSLFVPELDNTHFDADGHFSYRRGVVTLYPVEPALADTLFEAELEDWVDWDYESDLFGQDDSDITTRDTLIALTVIFQLIPALVFTVIHLVKFLRAHGAMRRRRAILFSTAAAWFGTGVWIVVALAMCL